MRSLLLFCCTTYPNYTQEELLSKIAEQDLGALRYASEELKADREFMLKAVGNHGRALEFASEDLRKDREVVLAAVAKNGGALQFASEDLRGDREVVLKAVCKHGFALHYANTALRKDREVVLAAVMNHSPAFEYASEELKKDQEISSLARMRRKTLISDSGLVTVTAKILDGKIQQLQSATIKDAEDNRYEYFFEYSDDRLFYRKITNDGNVKTIGEKIKIDTNENNRILAFLMQLGDLHVTDIAKDRGTIVTDATNFAIEIDKLKQQSNQSQDPIIKIFTIPGHAFVMVFEKGNISCFDNGGLKNEIYQKYFDKIKPQNESNISYTIIPNSYILSFQDVKGNQVNISINKQDFVCRHLANIIAKKLEELKNKAKNDGKSLSECSLEYLGGLPSKLMRANSFKQFEGDQQSLSHQVP